MAIIVRRQEAVHDVPCVGERLSQPRWGALGRPFLTVRDHKNGGRGECVVWADGCVASVAVERFPYGCAEDYNGSQRDARRVKLSALGFACETAQLLAERETGNIFFVPKELGGLA